MDGFGALVLIGLALGLVAFTQARAASNLNFLPGSITGFTTEGINPVATVELIIQNTSNVTFTIASFSANAYSNGTLIGNASDFTPDIVQPNSEYHYPVTIRLFTLSILDDLINAFTTKQISRDILLKGTVNANGQQWPVEVTFSLG